MAVNTTQVEHSWFPGASMAPEALADIAFTRTDEIVVEVELATAPGVRAPLTEGADYTVTVPSGASWGSVTALGAWAAGDLFHARRVTARTQEELFTPFQLKAEAVGAADDKAIRIAQEQDVEIARAPRVLRGQTAPALDTTGLIDGDLLQLRDGALRRVPRASFAGRYYAGDATGALVPASGTGGGDAALREDLALAGAPIVGMGNGRSLAQKAAETVSPLDLLAVGDGVSDDSAAVAAAMAATGKVHLADGSYRVAEDFLATAPLRGPGELRFGEARFSINDSEAVLGAMPQMAGRIGDLDQLRKAFTGGSAKIVFWGDSIAEGQSQIAGADSWPALLQQALHAAAPGKTLTFENYSIAGRGVGEANSATFVGTAGAVTPGVNFNQAKYGSGAIPDPTLWPNGTTVGKSWRETVRDAAPDLLVIALSINDTADPDAVCATLRSLVNNYISTCAKTPSIVLVTPIMPTRLQPTQLAQQANIEANAHAIRALGEELNVTVADANRLWLLLRDGVDVARDRFARFDGAAGYTTLISGAAPAAAGSTLTFAATGIVHRPKLQRDFVAGCTIVASGAQVGGIWYRSKPGDPNKAYVVQIERAVPQVVLYYNSVALASAALPASADYAVVVEAIGARHRVLIDARDGTGLRERISIVDAKRTAPGYCGFQGSAGLTIADVATRLGYRRQIGPNVLTEADLLGTDDYATESFSLGGNALNHPSIFGHLAVTLAFAPLLGVVRAMAGSTAPQVFEANLAVADGTTQNLALSGSSGLFVVQGPTAPFTIGGLTGGREGRRVTLFNFTTHALTLTHQDAASADGNRFILPGSASLVVPSFGSIDTFFVASAGSAGAWAVLA